MTTFTASQEEELSHKVEAYVRWCTRYFDDLPMSVQASLEHDVREIVVEITTELNGDPADLVGSPERFIAELRSAADLPPRPVADPPPPPVPTPAAGPPTRPTTQRRPRRGGQGVKKVAGGLLLAVALAMTLGLCSAEGELVDPVVGADSEALQAISGGASLTVVDLDTREVVWETTTPRADLAALLESNPTESARGFRFAFGTNAFEASGQVPTWEALVATIDTYAEGS